MNKDLYFYEQSDHGKEYTIYRYNDLGLQAKTYRLESDINAPWVKQVDDKPMLPWNELIDLRTLEEVTPKNWFYTDTTKLYRFIYSLMLEGLSLEYTSFYIGNDKLTVTFKDNLIDINLLPSDVNNKDTIELINKHSKLLNKLSDCILLDEELKEGILTNTGNHLYIKLPSNEKIIYKPIKE